MRPRALILDDDAPHSSALEAAAIERGFDVVSCTRNEEIDRLAPDAGFVVAFLGIDFLGTRLLELIEDVRIRNASEIVLMNATDDPVLVNRAVARGATYFFVKPFDSSFVDALLRDLAAEVRPGTDPEALESAPDQFGLLRGASAAMRRLYRTMRKVAASSTSVLLIGESGTGKELVARSLHMMSARAERDFVAVNCAAIPKELFESELFGHEKGSFSGALRRHHGYFERANGGTLFLDEITEMPVELQAKLLRVLELGEFRRVGGEVDLKTDARIIASTNRSVESAIDEGALREDLYYRVARFPLRIPALRDRGSDVRALALFFLNELNSEYGTAIGLSDDALARIESYAWPGNVRELRSAIERAYILANDEIGLAHLRGLVDVDPVREEFIRVPATASVEEAERALIFAALEAHRGDKRAAAESLGISLKTLYNRLNRYADEA